MDISTVLNKAAQKLQQAGVEEPRREAASLLVYVLQKDTAFLIAHPEYDLAANQKLLFESCVRRRAKREPFQYIVGRQEFYGLEFDVTPDVLIPRPETEILVEEAINILSLLENPRFCEVGVGSGCISVAILANVRSATAVSIDISYAASQVARANATKHKVGGSLTLHRGDVFGNIKGPFDLIVSNPPYIPSGDIKSLQAEVRDFEPSVALDGGEDGLYIIKSIIRESPEFLMPQGFLLLEIGFDQAAKVRELFGHRMWETPEFLPDLQGIPRILKVIKKTH